MLKTSTIIILEKIAIENLDNCDSWDISTILWGFSKFDGYDSDELFKLAEPKVIDLMPEFSNSEFINVFRAFTDN